MKYLSRLATRLAPVLLAFLFLMRNGGATESAAQCSLPAPAVTIESYGATIEPHRAWTLRARDAGSGDSIEVQLIADNVYVRISNAAGTSRTELSRPVSVVPDSLAVPERTFNSKPTILLGGQSNAERLAPFLNAYSTLSGYWRGNLAIADFEPEGSASGLLEALPSHLDGFVWFQGEADRDTPADEYTRRLESLVSRVRALTARPSLPILVVQLTSDSDYDRIREVERAWATTDRFASYVQTDDLPFADRAHLTTDGYAQLARRIVSLLLDAVKKQVS